jgi:hypothetical protein
MGPSGRGLYTISASIFLLFLVVLFSLDALGRKSRVMGAGGLPSDRGVRKAVVDFPDEAYSLWKAEGFRGRVVLSFGKRLNFVLPEEGSLMPPMPFPMKPFNLSDYIEGTLKPENFLFVSMEKGIAREIIHIVPDKVFYEKALYARRQESAAVEGQKIEFPHLGSPRTITTVGSFRPPVEPVLLYVNASYFEDSEPEELLGLLLKAGLKTDYVVLSRSLDDGDVEDEEREKLMRFMMLLEGGGGKD